MNGRRQFGSRLRNGGCRSQDKAEVAVSEIKAAGIKGSLSTVQLDVTDEKSVAQAAAHVEQKFGRLDVLVNNAGVGNRDPDVRTRFQACMDTNVVGPAVVSAYFRPLLFKSQRPYSIYISSGGGSMALASDPTRASYRSPLASAEAYRASKAALNTIALQESIEFDSTAFKVFALTPGFVRSNLRGQSEEEKSGWGNAGDPEDAGKTVLSILEGTRDADAGKFIRGDGLEP